jgi:hypothetical protein
MSKNRLSATRLAARAAAREAKRKESAMASVLARLCRIKSAAPSMFH